MAGGVVMIKARRQIFDMARENVGLNGVKCATRRRGFHGNLPELRNIYELLDAPGQRENFAQGIERYRLGRKFAPSPA